MTCYSVISVTPTSEDWIADYVEHAGKLVAKHGGEYVARTTSHEQLEGAPLDGALRVIIKWPSKEAALAWMNDPDYQPYLKARTDGSNSTHLVIEGKDDLA